VSVPDSVSFSGNQIIARANSFTQGEFVEFSLPQCKGADRVTCSTAVLVNLKPSYNDVDMGQDVGVMLTAGDETIPITLNLTSNITSFLIRIFISGFNLSSCECYPADGWLFSCSTNEPNVGGVILAGYTSLSVQSSKRHCCCSCQNDPERVQPLHQSWYRTRGPRYIIRTHQELNSISMGSGMSTLSSRQQKAYDH